MPHLRLLAGALAASLLASPAPAGAAEPPRTSALGWVRLPGAETCADARELARAVERRLGRAVFASPAQADVLIEGRIEPAPPGPGFRAHLALADARGAPLGLRDLEGAGADCRALDEQLALVVALLIDPEAALAPPRAPAPPVVVERVFVPAPAPAPAPPPREPWRASVALGPVAAIGLLPGVGFGVALRGELTPPALFPFEIGGAVWLDARAEPAGAASPATKGAVLSLAYASLGLCPLHWSSGGTRLRGCADLDVGAVRAVGFGFASGGAGDEQVVAQATVAGRVTQRLVGPLELGLGLGLMAPLHRVRFFYVDAAQAEQELFRMSAVAGRLDLGLGLAFP
jgi:hypothetical protein